MFNGRLMCRIASFGQCVFVVHSQIRRPRPAALHFLCMPLLNSRRPGRANLEGDGLRRRASAAEAGRPVPRHAVMEFPAAGAGRHPVRVHAVMEFTAAGAWGGRLFRVGPDVGGEAVFLDIGAVKPARNRSAGSRGRDCQGSDNRDLVALRDAVHAKLGFSRILS